MRKDSTNTTYNALHGTLPLKFQLDDDAYTPLKATDGAAGYDLTASQRATVPPAGGNAVTVHTGVHAQIPDGYVGLLVARSSLQKRGLSLANSIGIIDSDYRGEIKIRIRSYRLGWPQPIRRGERIAQLVIIPTPETEMMIVNKLTPTRRGDNGFGSTGETR